MRWKILFCGILVSSTIIINSCTDDFSILDLREIPSPLVLVITHSSDSTSFAISRHVEQTFDYAGVPHAQIDIARPKMLSIPASTKLIYIATDFVEEFTDQEVSNVVRFVAQGNQLNILTPIYDERFAFLTGIREEAEYNMDNKAEGFYFNEDIFPNYKGLKYQTREPYVHNGFRASAFIPNAKLIASAVNDSTYPAIVEHELGKGRSIYFNTIVMRDKDYRGLLFSVGLKALEGIPYRVANVNTIFLDDFPAPLYHKKMPPIDEEYNLNHIDFVTKVWWPDMKALADIFNIDYTAILAFNYNAVVVPPFDFEEWKAGIIEVDDQPYHGSSWLARDVRDSRHELGFHGYNHFSLWLEDWKNREFMETAVEAAKKQWIIDRLGDLPVTYVPPTNLIDSVGLSSITRRMPSIRYMSSLYLGHIDYGGGREFGPDPFASSLFDYPRITSGFINNDISNFDQNSLFIYTGIWTHFVHPDDVFQVMQRDEDPYASRNPLGLGWHSDSERDYGLYEVFEERLRETLERYPVSRFLAARDAAPIVESWLAGRSYYEFGKDDLTVKYKSGVFHSIQKQEKFWFLYANKENSEYVEPALAQIDPDFKSSRLWDGKLYQFSSTADSLRLPNLSPDSDPEKEMVTNVLNTYNASIVEEIGMSEVMTDSSQNVQPENVAPTLKQVMSQLEEDPSSITVQNQAINVSVREDSLEIAIDILEDRISNQNDWSKIEMLQLIKYYGWNNEIDRSYAFSDSLWESYEDERALLFNELIVSQYGSPNLQHRLRWSKRQLELNPNKKKLLTKLIQLNDSEGDWPEKKKYIQQLLSLNPESDTLYAYAVQQSLTYDDAPKTLRWLENFPQESHEQLKGLADDIAYLYAENDELTKAGVWAEKSSEISKETRLYWLIEQKRYYEFLNTSERYLGENPDNNSLRSLIGRQLYYQNFRSKAYDVLYPLFEKSQSDSATKALIHSEIGYMGYEQKKKMIKQYPAFFSDSLSRDFITAYRKNEAFQSGIGRSLASDNFSNRIERTELFAGWGDRRSFRHRSTLQLLNVNTSIDSLNMNDDLYWLQYGVTKANNTQSREFSLAAGLFIKGNQIYPNFAFSGRQSSKSSYTSSQFELRPVFANTALEQNINQLKGQIYREDQWLNNTFQTSATISSTWFTNKNISFEGNAKLYAGFPLARERKKIRPFIDFTFADARTTYTSGRPYYTPDNLVTRGIGLQLNFQSQPYDPNFLINLEGMRKHDNKNGKFWASSGQLSIRIKDFWQLNLEGYLSTSEIYRYNSINIGLSHIFDRKIRR